MKIHTADYIKSAPSLKDCPDFGNMPEIVLVGRSNVGKSSFINSMTQRKNLARTSNTPGKTRYLNFYSIAYSAPKKSKSLHAPKPDVEKLLFVDLPGYGYAKVSKTEQEQWRKNFEHYLEKRDNIRLVIQLLDARHGPQENDIRMFEWLQFHGRQVLIVLTKMDKLSRGEMTKHVSATAKALDIAPGDILGYSAENHMGRDAAWQIVQSVLDTAPIPTGLPEDP